MFLSLNTEKKIASFESLKEHDGHSNENFLSTNSRSENVDFGELTNKKQWENLNENSFSH
jgi:hypothetical protein